MDSKKTRVLLIEDNVIDSEWVKRALRASGSDRFNLKWADTPSKGLELLAREGFDIILLDMRLPEGSGLELFDKVHSLAPHLPIVILTGALDEEPMALQALERGAQDFLLKGKIDSDTLTRSLRYSIERYRLLAELEKLMLVKSEFVSTVSHELRTPLTAIKESASLIRDEVTGKVNEEQKHFLIMIDQSVDRLTELIDNMLDLAKIESGKMEFKRRKVRVKDLIETTLKQYESITSSRKLKIDLLEVPDVFADSNKILQVLGNLLSNAIKFTKDNGTITFKAQEQNGEIAISVQDNGTGIAKGDFPKLFQKFSQVGTTEKRPRGTGLGLSLCKQIMEIHGGIIFVTSEPGKGSEFTFTLPVYTSKLALEESFREQLELAKESQESSVGLIAIDSEILIKNSDHNKGPDALEHLEEVTLLLCKNLHSTDTVLIIDPHWFVIFAATDAKGLEAIVERLPKILEKNTPGSLDFGSALYPRDGIDIHSLLKKATTTLNHVSTGGH